MNQFRHCRRTNKQRQPTINPQHPRPRINAPNIPQHPGPEPNPIKASLIRIPRKQIIRRARIKRPRLRTGRLGRYDLEIMRVDQRVQWRFLVLQDYLRIGAGRFLDPVIGDCGFV